MVSLHRDFSVILKSEFVVYLQSKNTRKGHFIDLSNEYKFTYTPNANVGDRSVGARHESHESEASQSSMFCCDSVSPEKSCSVVENLRWL